jgi:hypothetical protein
METESSLRNVVFLNKDWTMDNVQKTNNCINMPSSQILYPILLLLCVFVAKATRLPSRCLAMKAEIHFTEPLPSNDRRDTQTHKLNGRSCETRRWDVLRFHDIIRSFIKISSGIQKLIRGDIQTDRQHGDRISLFLFFQNKESRLKEFDFRSTVL